MTTGLTFGEFEGAGADVGPDLPFASLLQDFLRIDRGSRKEGEQESGLAVQTELNGVLVERLPRLNPVEELPPTHVQPAIAPQGGDGVGGRQLLAVVEGDAPPQPDGIHQAIVADRMPLGQLGTQP